MLAALILLGFWASTASAHLGSTKYLRVEQDAAASPERAASGRAIVVVASIETVDVAMQLGLREEASAQEVLARAPDITSWLTGGIQVLDGGVPCASRADTPTEEQRDQRSFIRIALHYRCASSGGAATAATAPGLVLHDDTVFSDDPQHEALVYVGGQGESAAVLRGGHRSLELEGPPQSALELAGTFLWEGVLHFALGYDHVLFLLSLLLGVGLGPERELRAAPTQAGSVRSKLRGLAWLVTAFTVGHSATLALAALEVVVLPSQPVEIAIAASIVAVALHTARAPRQRRVLPWVAGAFGLIHGFGFSSVLRELGLPAGGTVVALVAFNVGIELAQLAFVALVIGPLLRLARSPHYERVVVRGGSLVIAVVASYWVVERVLGG